MSIVKFLLKYQFIDVDTEFPNDRKFVFTTMT